MRAPIISAAAVAVALSLNSPGAFGEEHLKPARVDFRNEDGSKGVTGRLITLYDYLAKEAQVASTNTYSTLPTSAVGASTAPGAPARILAVDGRDRIESLAPNPGYQADRRGSRLAPSADGSASRLGRDPSPGQALVLIIPQGPVPDAQSLTPRPSFGQIPVAETKSGEPTANPPSQGGQAFILVFGDDTSGQTTYLSAWRMMTDGSSNWATLRTEAPDRLPVRGTDDRDVAERREASGLPERIDPTRTRSTVPRDSASKRVTDDSQVRVTGKITSSGGIHSIVVSEF